MKPSRYLRFGLIGLALILLVCGIASALPTPVPTVVGSSSSSTGTATYQDSSSLVYVSGVDTNPQVFYPYETGTVTVHLANSGTSPVGLSAPDLLGPNVKVMNKDSFQTVSYIGPAATMDVSFVVAVNGQEGTFYPLFTIGIKGAGSIHYPVKMVVSSTDLRASVSGRPSNFAVSKMDQVNLSIINPRQAPLTNVLVTADGEGSTLSPSVAFISNLTPSGCSIVSFQFTPVQAQQPNLTFHITYNNGDNQHSQDVVLPVNLGSDKTGANPVINNIVLTTTSGSYQMTGDVSNAGITDAKSMVLSVGDPVRPVEPYPNYAIGSLASDDFSSFTLTFTATDLSAVPVQVQWKDAQGNSFTSTTTLDLRTMASASFSGTSSGSRATGANSGLAGANAAGGAANRGGGGGMVFGIGGGRSGGIASFYPVIAGGIILVVGIVLYTKRKWVMTKLKKQ